MTIETRIEQIEQLIDQLLHSETEYFRVGVRIKPTNNIKVFLEGDNGLPIEKCVYFNHQLYKMIEEKELFPSGDFSLEVSSPGLDQPLKLHRQYLKNKGRQISVVLTDGAIKEGKMLEVTDNDILLEEITGKGKKAVTQQLVIPFDHIKTTTVQILF